MDCRNRSGRRSILETLEVADKTNFRLEPNAELFLDSILRDDDELSYILRRRTAEIHHDVGVNVRDLRISMAESLEAALVNQTPCSHSLDLLEDRSSTR